MAAGIDPDQLVGLRRRKWRHAYVALTELSVAADSLRFVSDSTARPFPWPPGVATGIGSLPGTDIVAATRFVLDELPDFPYLPELPQRGAGADLIGRAATLLTDLHVDLQPSGWRLVSSPGVDERRARDYLDRDLDTLGDLASEIDTTVKLQIAGPLTLAAGLELARGEAALADHGAVSDIASALADGVATMIAEVERRLPKARLVIQVDEPTAPAVLTGRVATASGFGTLRAVPEPTASDLIGGVIDAIQRANATPVVHCCAGNPPIGLFAGAGARGVSVDATLVTGSRATLDAIGNAIDNGVAVFWGCVPALGPGVPPSVREVANGVRKTWHELGFPPERLPETVVVTPACGLAGASSGWMHTSHRLIRAVAKALADAPEEERHR